MVLNCSQLHLKWESSCATLQAAEDPPGWLRYQQNRRSQSVPRFRSCAQELAVWFPRHFTLSTKMSLPTWSSSFLFLSGVMKWSSLNCDAMQAKLLCKKMNIWLCLNIKLGHSIAHREHGSSSRQDRHLTENNSQWSWSAWALPSYNTALAHVCNTTIQRRGCDVWRRGWRNAFCEQRRWLMWPHSRWSSLSLSSW